MGTGNLFRVKFGGGEGEIVKEIYEGGISGMKTIHFVG